VVVKASRRSGLWTGLGRGFRPQEAGHTDEALWADVTRSFPSRDRGAPLDAAPLLHFEAIDSEFSDIR